MHNARIYEFFFKPEHNTIISGNLTVCKLDNPFFRQPMCAWLLADRILLSKNSDMADDIDKISLPLDQATIYICSGKARTGPFQILLRVNHDDTLLEFDTLGAFEKWRAHFKNILTSLHGDHGKTRLHKVRHFSSVTE
ncbi:hypothetical protein BDF19DRAFT_135097 [Syncephalis fuscata]|nr:hypothetical protein BDF19DRAFT_135097 [Syncephalis fuscata]